MRPMHLVRGHCLKGDSPLLSCTMDCLESRLCENSPDEHFPGSSNSSGSPDRRSLVDLEGRLRAQPRENRVFTQRRA
jgi:hypothetical protein